MARIVLAGYLVRNPLGGYAWQAAHYLLGLRALGHDAWFYEDTGHYAQAYNPRTNEFGEAYAHGLAATADEAVAALAAIRGDYERSCRSARELAEAYFRAEDVCARMLADAGLS